MENKKGKKLFINGIVLALVGVYLAVYFSLSGMWSAGTVFAIVLIAALSAFQFTVYFKFFRIK